MRNSRDGIPYQKYVRSCELNYGDIIEYVRVRRHKDLSVDTWSYEDHDDFVELLCVSDGWALRDDPRNRGLKDVPTMCTVKFRKKGVSILSALDFYKVLGEIEGRNQVRKFCQKMNILLPWDKSDKQTSILQRLLRKHKGD